MTWHLDPTLVGPYVRGELTGQAAASVDAHLPTCADCRAAVAAATGPDRLAAIWSGVAAGIRAGEAVPSAAARATSPFAPLRRFELGVATLAVAMLVGSVARVATGPSATTPVVAAPASEEPTATPEPVATEPEDPTPTATEPEPTATPTGDAVVAPTPTEPPTPAGTVVAASTVIEAFDGCTSLESHLRTSALDRVTAWGLPGGSGGPAVAADPASDGSDAPAAGPPAPTAPDSAPDASDTNVQEAGVDEPDIVETDGTHAFVVAGSTLRVLAVADGAPRSVGELELGQWDSSLLLVDDRLLVLSPSWGDEPAPDQTAPAADGDGDVAASSPSPSGQPATVLRLVDVSDPTRPTVVDRADVDGWLVSARSVDGIARIVVRAVPSRLPFVYPDGQRTEDEALAHNREVVAASTIEQWVPLVRRGSQDTAPAATCEQTVTPSAFAGFGSLSVLTVDVRADLADLRATTVLTEGETVYASRSTLYVATSRWWDEVGEPVEDFHTDLHAFDIAAPGAARYLASGSVPGHLLNQFSMSEHAGHLRVATTEGAPWADGTISGVHVLARQGDVLATVGSVGGLGQDERIFAVRFLGDVGYVVTFRQVDPLYTLDLRDPTAPRVVGELKIPGYSAYLHPAGPGALLGLGQDATEDGQVTGTQMSLFDVTDLAAPRQQSKVTFPDASSEAEWDHHAFLYWQPAGLVLVPLTTWSDQHWTGVVAVAMSDGQLREAGRIAHPEDPGSDWQPPIRRSFVVGEAVFTVSDLGVQANDLRTLESRGYVPFAG